MTIYLSVLKKNAKKIKILLENENALNKKIPPIKDDCCILFPLIYTDVSLISKTFGILSDLEIYTTRCKDPIYLFESKEDLPENVNDYEKLKIKTKEWINKNTELSQTEFILNSIPTKWERINNFLFLSKKHINYDILKSILTSDELNRFFEQVICNFFKVDFVAIKEEILKGSIRKPNIQILYKKNENIICYKIENKILYLWYPEHTMFCKSNITEKLRISKQISINSDPYNYNFGVDTINVLDLYCGIGYFIFPYFRRFPKANIVACDMNIWSIKSMLITAKVHGIFYELINECKNEIYDIEIENLASKYKKIKNIGSIIEKLYGNLTVCIGNNEDYLHYYKDKVQHVNLGLIPDSKQGYDLAILALNPHTGGILHIHQNIDNNLYKQFLGKLITVLTYRFHNLRGFKWSVEPFSYFKVKSYAPKVDHYVFDVLCLPIKEINLSNQSK